MSVTTRKRLVQKYYSQRARDYDSQKIRTWKSEQGFVDEVLSRLIDSLAGLEDKPVLDVCTGTGRTSLPLLKKIKPWLVGLDLSREMLGVAKTKLSSCRESFSLIIGDAEHLPFQDKVFSAVICTSAMHYFTLPERLLKESSRMLQENGAFIYGDLTLHELDDRGFLNRLERTVSPSHGSYLKPSEIKKMLSNNRFQVSSADTIAYSKPFSYLIEDKAKYFGVKPAAVYKCLEAASSDETKLYSLGGDELTLFYTLIKAMKKE